MLKIPGLVALALLLVVGAMLLVLGLGGLRKVSTRAIDGIEQAAATTREFWTMEGGQAQTDPEKWRALLQELSDLAIADDEVRARLTPEQIHNRWLGEPPATEEQIEAAERRLGAELPPSYRAFLKVSNGWHWPAYNIIRLASTDEIGLTRDLDRILVDAWSETDGEPEIHLKKTLLVSVPSDYDDGDRLMLNPERVVDGEMEAWTFSDATPGADPHRSFWHLMVSEVQTWRYLAAQGD